MKALTPAERFVLERAVAGDTWDANEELPIVESLHRQGLLGRVDLDEHRVRYPPIPASALALRIDNAFRQSGGKS
jgi:hypothetical protein